MVDFVPALNIEEESGTIDLLEYLKEKWKMKNTLRIRGFAFWKKEADLSEN
jgi:hypothetical protein